MFKQLFSEGEDIKLVPVNEEEFTELQVPVEEVATIHLVVGRCAIRWARRD
jgi:hypothetical protein